MHVSREKDPAHAGRLGDEREGGERGPEEAVALAGGLSLNEEIRSPVCCSEIDTDLARVSAESRWTRCGRRGP